MNALSSLLNSLWAGLERFLPLIVFALIVLFVIFVIIPRMANAASNIIWAVLGIVGIFVLASFLGIQIPFIGNIQANVVNWFDHSFLPALNSFLHR